MNAIHLRRHIDSDHLHIPELRAMMGQDVEITITPQVTSEEEPVETLETFLGDSLHRPPPGPEEMEQLRKMAETEPAIAAALRMAQRGGLDLETILAGRNAS